MSLRRAQHLALSLVFAPSVAHAAEDPEGLEPALVEQVVERDSGVLDCYATELGRDPLTAGHASVTLLVGRYGKITDAVVDSQCVAGDRFRRCLERKLRNVSFPPNTPQTTITRELMFNSGIIGHVVRDAGDDIAICAGSARPPDGGRFTMAWKVIEGEVTSSRVVDSSFDAEALARCISVKSESWGWDFSRWTSGEVRYAFRFVASPEEAGSGPAAVGSGPVDGGSEPVGGGSEPVGGAAVGAPAMGVSPGVGGEPPVVAADDGEVGWWGEVRTGGELVVGNRDVITVPIRLSGGERWGSNELLGEATGETTARWHVQVRYNRWLGDRAGVHGLVVARDDRFAGYARRTQLGAGYTRILAEGDLSVWADLGFEYAIEDYVPAATQDWQGVLGVRAALPVAWQPAEGWTLTETPVLYQNVRDGGDSRLHNGLAVRRAFGDTVAVELAHTVVWDRRPVRGKQSRDQSIVLGVVLGAGSRPAIRGLEPLF